MSESRRFLVFRLYGALAGWGEIAVGEVRSTSKWPPRSAILGLLGAALGIRREDEAAQLAFANDYGIALAVPESGTPLRDYHTIRRPPQRAKLVYPTRHAELNTLRREELATTISVRDYRTDSTATIAVWLRNTAPHWTLDVIEQALRKPHFVLYLGRKSCPLAMPLQPQIIENAESPLAALQSARFVTEDDFRSGMLPHQLPMPAANSHENSWICSDEAPEDTTAGHYIMRRDQPSSRLRWQFLERIEYRRPPIGDLP